MQTSLFQLFEEVVASNSSKAAYLHKEDGQWIPTPWTDVRTSVFTIARGLLALEVKHGDRVCILSQTRPEWVTCDLATVSCGAVTVGIYPSNLPEDCAYIIDHCDAEVIFLEDADQLGKILEVKEKLPNLRHIVIYEGDTDAADNVLSWQDFLAGAESIPEEAFLERAAALQADDLASIVYTSGTTGVPKGAMITHHNLIFTSGSVVDCLYLEPHYVNLMFLPLAHVFARLIAYTCLRYAATMAFAESFLAVPENLKEIKPHFFASVPRLYEKVYDKVMSGAEDAGGLKKMIFDWALGIGKEVSRLQQAGKPVPALLGLQHSIAHKLVFEKIHAAVGGRLAWAISGAAPLNKTIAEFFHACGILLLEGIGMTENTSFSHINRFNGNKFGTVGQPGPGVEQALAEDGEVLIRGDNVMKGYFKNPEATAETIDEEGWLHTGDIGEIDEDGFLKITDRKKDLIITAGGKNIAPQHIEQVMRTSRYVSQMVAYGDKRKYISALVTLDPDAILTWAAAEGFEGASLEELSDDPKVRELILTEVEERNQQLASYETIKRFHILPREFSIEDGELTPTLKIKRKIIVGKYQAELDGLYD